MRGTSRSDRPSGLDAGAGAGLIGELPELFRVVQQDGFIVVTVKITLWEPGFEEYLTNSVNPQGEVNRSRTVIFTSVMMR